MKILIVNYEFPPVGGGASHASYCLAKELVHLGHEIDVLTSRYGGQPELETLDGISVYRVTSWRKSVHDCGLRSAASFVVFAFFKLRKLLRHRSYDLTHYFFSLPTGVLSLYSEGIRRLPYVLSLRGSDVPGYDASSFKLKVLHVMLRPLTRYIWGRARCLVAVSQEFRRLALKTDSAVLIEVIYNGVDPQRFPGRERRRNAKPVRVLCVSRLIKRKVIRYLLEAVARLGPTGLSVWIVGTGEMEAELKALAQRLNIAAQVEFLGYLPNQQLGRYYEAADIFVLPTLSEAFANVCLEAMSSGLPVIMTNVGGNPEIVEPEINGLLVPPAQADALAAALRRLTNEPGLRSQISANNVAKIQRDFTWTYIAERYQALYQRVAG